MSAQESRLQLIPSIVHARRAEVPPSDIVIGKDVLELITAAMYVDPLSIYREYVQNAADSIDDAREAQLFAGVETPKLEILLDAETRTVRIRDNGISVPAQEFVRRLLAIGASTKRGTRRRGFRGIGRLAGLGYCQELLFRGRAEGEESVFEVSWDARALRQALRADAGPEDLASTIRQVANETRLPGDGSPRRFFEVELKRVVRIKNDILLNPEVVAGYLSQIAPVPFRAEFGFAQRIEEFLRSHGVRAPFDIAVNGGEPLARPFPTSFGVTPKIRDRFKDITFLEIPGIDGGIDAAGWVLDHGYHGSLPRSLAIGGLRVRSGDMQVGGNDIVAQLFVEPRFNGWAVGEFHVLSPKIVPNGRRDDFEYSAHYANFQSHLTRLAAELTRTCRSRSNARRVVRTLHERVARYEADLPLIRSIPLELSFRSRQLDAMTAGLAQCRRHLNRLELRELEKKQVEKNLDVLARRIEQAKEQTGNRKFLERLPAAKRRVYAEVLSGIYETLGDLKQAHNTVLRLLKRASGRRRKDRSGWPLQALPRVRRA